MPSSLIRSAAIAGAVLVLAGFAWWLVARPSTGDRLAAGKAIYDAQCAACHGAKLEGQPDWRTRRPDGKLPAPPHDASGHTWHHADADLFALTKHGLGPFAPPGYQSDMPAFADRLSDRDIEDVLAYIKSTWPPEIQARQSALSGKAGGR